MCNKALSVLLGTLALLWIATPSSALTTDEISALRELYDNFPLLSTSTGAPGRAAAWNSSVELICDSRLPANYWYGVVCSGTSVIAITIDDQWGFPLRDEFVSFSGLTALITLYGPKVRRSDATASPNSSSLICPLVQLPLTCLALNLIQFDAQIFPPTSISTIFTSLQNISSLTVILSTKTKIQDDVIAKAVSQITTLSSYKFPVDYSKTFVDFSRMPALAFLVLDDSTYVENDGYSVQAGLATAPASVDLIFTNALITDTAVFRRFTTLQTLKFAMPSNIGTPTNFSIADFPTSSLQTLTIDNLPADVTSLDFSPLSIRQQLTLNGGNLSTIIAWSPSTTSISISGHPNLVSLPPLPSTITQFTLQGAVNLPSFPASFFSSANSLSSLTIGGLDSLTGLPSDLTSRPTLTQVTIGFTAISDASQLCKMPQSIQALTIRDYPGATNPLPFPLCFSSLAQLTTVTISNIANMPPNATSHLPSSLNKLTAKGLSRSPVSDWPFLVSAFPNLVLVSLSNCSLSGTFPAELKNLPLQNLDLSNNNLIGTVPASFISSLTALVTFDISGNALSGNVSLSIAPPLLQRITLSRNQFTALSAPQSNNAIIFSLLMDENRWTSLPTTAAWNNLAGLQILRLNGNPQLAGQPLPTFWTTHPTISDVDFSQCGFVGPIPAITAPKLRYLRLDDNALCGSLPEVLTTLPTLLVASFANNSFSGSIPASYVNVSFGSLDLTSNHLAGGFSSLVSSVGGQHLLSTLRIGDNDFFGDLPRMSKMRRLNTFDASNTYLDLCDANPGLLPSVSMCASTNMPNGGSCSCQSWYTTCDPSAQSCTRGGYVPRAVSQFDSCGTTPISVPFVLSCDPKSMPAPDFSCVNGAWTSDGSVAGPISVSTSIVVVGNLTSESIDIFNPSASITVKGCIGTTSIQFVLTPAQLKELEAKPSKHVLTQLGSNCSSSLSAIQVSSSVSGKSCKRVTASTDLAKSDASNLVVTFTVNSSKCNVWWIVVASVLSGLVLIVLIIAILSVTLTPFRKKIAPFWNRGGNEATTL